MTKIDKSQYSKAEWKALRERRRQEKMNSYYNTVVEEQLHNTSTDKKNYIVCLKHGTKYDEKYVNILYNMVQRNCTIPHEFVCFTENSRGLNKNITVKPLPEIPNVKGWWYKPMFFDPNFPLKGTILFFDLDVIIFKNIDYLFSYNPSQFCILKDFNRSVRSQWKKFNSSVFRLETGSLPHVYTDFIRNPNEAIRRFHGDQDWIYFKVKNGFSYWPDEWIQSYKWEMRNRPTLIRQKDGTKNFRESGVPTILPKTSVAVFHGEPNPHNCVDQWCKENWK